MNRAPRRDFMRGMFRCHVAATAITLAAIGGAFAQSSVVLTSQNSETSPAAENTAPTAPPAATPPSAPATTPEPTPLTGPDLLQAPLASNLQGSDAAAADKLRELLATKLNRIIERKQDRAG